MRHAIATALLGLAVLLGAALSGCEEQRLDEDQREEYEEALEQEPVLEAERPEEELGPNQRLGREGLVGGATPDEPTDPAR